MKLLILLILISSPVVGATENQLVIRVGDTVTTKITKITKIIVTNGKNIQVTALGSKLSIRAKSPGTSRITTSGTSIEVNCLTKEEYREYKILKESLSHMRGLDLDVKRPTMFLSGELLRSSDWSDIVALDIQKLDLKFKAKVHPQARLDVKKMLVAYLGDHHVPAGDINLSGIPTITYNTAHLNQFKTYKDVLRPTGLNVETNPLAISTAPMVRTNIVVASIHRDKVHKLGLSWPNSYTAQTLGDENSLVLRLLEKRGWGRVLASPTLLCRSGKEASFFAGGEIPIRLIGYRQKGVTWKSYGVRLKVKPLADYQGQMSINIETEVSNIDESQKIDDIPAILSNRMNSHFDLTQSRTIALSGLITEDKGESREGLPYLSRLPVLGSFFSSQDYRDHKSELVIFVTPEIVLPTDTSESPPLPGGWENNEL